MEQGKEKEREGEIIRKQICSCSHMIARPRAFELCYGKHCRAVLRSLRHCWSLTCFATCSASKKQVNKSLPVSPELHQFNNTGLCQLVKFGKAFANYFLPHGTVIEVEP